jgi:hypothetical protein
VGDTSVVIPTIVWTSFRTQSIGEFHMQPQPIIIIIIKERERERERKKNP